jgi:hypothetical protein
MRFSRLLERKVGRGQSVELQLQGSHRSTPPPPPLSADNEIDLCNKAARSYNWLPAKETRRRSVFTSSLVRAASIFSLAFRRQLSLEVAQLVFSSDSKRPRVFHFKVDVH